MIGRRAPYRVLKEGWIADIALDVR